MTPRGRKVVARRAALAVVLGGAALLLSGCSWSEVLGLGWPDGITPQAHLNRELWIGSVIASFVVGAIVVASVVLAVLRSLLTWGNLVLLRHNDRWMTAYAHMEHLNVRRGQSVKQGEMIGAVGSTGSTDSPQLHFEVRHGTEALNPAIYLKG